MTYYHGSGGLLHRLLVPCVRRDFRPTISREQGFHQVLRFEGCSKTAGGVTGKCLKLGNDRGTRGYRVSPCPVGGLEFAPGIFFKFDVHFNQISGIFLTKIASYCHTNSILLQLEGRCLPTRPHFTPKFLPKEGV